MSISCKVVLAVKILNVSVFGLFTLLISLQSVAEPAPLVFSKEAIRFDVEGPFLTWSLKGTEDDAVGGIVAKQFQQSLITDHQVKLSWPMVSSSLPTILLSDADGNVYLETIFKEGPDNVDSYSLNGKIINSGREVKSEKSFELELSSNDLKLSSLQICLFFDQEPNSSLVCFPKMESVTQIQPKLFIDEKIQSQSGSLELKRDQKFKMSIFFSNGVVIQMQDTTPLIEIHEIYKVDKDTAEIITFQDRPNPPSVKVTQERSTLFRPTIGDLRVFFKTKAFSEAPSIIVPSSMGLNTTFLLKLNDLPKAEDRIFLNPKAPRSTYGSSVDLVGVLPSGYKIETSQNKITISESEANSDHQEFQWNFASPEYLKLNTSVVQVTSPRGEVINQSFEVYRGFQTYLSARSGISVGTGGVASILANAQATHWFNEPFGDMYWLSRQRWGINAEFLEMLVSSQPESKYNIRNFDLMYRINPGVENWNETWGLVVGLAQLQLLSARPVEMGGAGILWSRSLPKWFDYAFGFIPFFRNPKWVDISVMGFSGLDQSVQGNSFQIRAVGRIDINRNTYFEGGWGTLSANYVDMKSRRSVAFAAGRGFLGFGYRF